MAHIAKEPEDLSTIAGTERADVVPVSAEVKITPVGTALRAAIVLSGVAALGALFADAWLVALGFAAAGALLAAICQLAGPPDQDA